MGHIAQYKLGFYYEQLGIDQKCNYRKIAQAVSDYRTDVNVGESNPKDLQQTLLAIKYDNPEFCFWSFDETKPNGDILVLQYTTENEEEASVLIQNLRNKRKSILANLLEEERKQSQEKLLWIIFDYLSQTIKYADDELQKPVCSQWIYDISGVLLKEKGVCLGIAMTVNYFCMAVHIPAILITGEANVTGGNGNHGWNMVELDGEYFHIDVTSAISQGVDLKNKYFLIKDKDLDDRNWSKNLYPKAV